MKPRMGRKTVAEMIDTKVIISVIILFEHPN